MNDDIASLRPFPLQVAHHPDEPGHAFLVRSLIHNGSTMFVRSLLRSGAPNGFSLTKVDNDRIAHLGGADPDAIAHASAKRGPLEVVLLGQTLRPEYFSDAKRRWCPDCLTEEPYHRAWWDVWAVTACPFHGRELATGCGCERPLQHGRSGVVQCRELHDLRLVETPRLAKEEILADRYIVQRLLGIDQPKNRVLDRMSLGDAIWTMERIGRSVLAEGLNSDDARRRHGIRRLIGTGFEALAALPGSFEAFLDLLLSRRTEKQLCNLGDAYGPFRRWLIDEAEANAGTLALRAMVERHADRNVVRIDRVVDRGRPVVGVQLSDAMVELGLSQELVARLATTMGYPLHVRKTVGGTLLAPADLQSIKERFARLRTMDQVTAELGVRWQTVVELADAGHLAYLCRPYDRSSPKGKRGNRPGRRLRDAAWNVWYFEDGSAAGLLRRLRDRLAPSEGAARDDLVSLFWTTRMFATKLQMIQFVLDGALPVRAIDTTAVGLSGIMVSASEAQALIQVERRGGYSLRAAAPLLGMHYNQVLSCMHAKLLRVTGDGTTMTVTEKEVQRFKAMYARTAEIGETIGGATHRVVIRHLRELGVEPVKVEGELKLTLYLRARAMAAVSRAPWPAAFKSSRHRKAHQRAMGLPIALTRRPDGEAKPRTNDRSGRL